MDWGRWMEVEVAMRLKVSATTSKDRWTPLYLTHTLSVTNYMSDKFRLSLIDTQGEYRGLARQCSR